MGSEAVKSRTFLGALGAAIKAVCMLLIDLTSVASEGVAMADAAVKAAREKQGVELTISMHDYAVVAYTKAARTMAEEQEQLQAYIAKDSTGERKKLVDANMERLKKAIEGRLSEIQVDRMSRQLV